MSESGWALRGMAHDLSRIAGALDDLEARRWELRRQAAGVDWDDAARSRIEGYCECADELLGALARELG